MKGQTKIGFYQITFSRTVYYLFLRRKLHTGGLKAKPPVSNEKRILKTKNQFSRYPISNEKQILKILELGPGIFAHTFSF